MPSREHIVVPLVQEQVSVGKRTEPVERVRVQKRVVEDEVPVELVSAREEIDVERIPIGSVVAAMPETRVEGDTTIVPVVEEMVVIEKRLFLREEIRITKRRTEHKRRVRVPVKREQVMVEREMSGRELRRR